MEPIFSIKNHLRKPKYSISTTGYIEADGEVSFKKIASSDEARTHIETCFKNHKTLSKVSKKMTIKVLEPLGHSEAFSWVSFRMVNGKTLERELLNDILTLDTKNIQKKVALVSKGLHQLNSASSELIPNLIAGDPNTRSPGVFDVNFDNIIIERNEMFLIDCEWVSNQRLEPRLIIARAIYYTLLRSKSILKHHHQRFSLLEDTRGVLIPKFIIDEGLLRKSDLSQIFKIEESLMQEVRLTHEAVTAGTYKLSTYQQKLPVGEVASIAKELKESRSELAAISVSKAQAETELTGIINGLKIENQRLNSIIHSPAKFSKHAAKFILKKVKR